MRLSDCEYEAIEDPKKPSETVCEHCTVEGYCVCDDHTWKNNKQCLKYNQKEAACLDG